MLLRDYRDSPSYRGVIPFLAGIVYQRDSTVSKQNTKRFFEALCQNVILDEEKVQREFIQIVIKSINECTDYLGPIPAVEELLQGHPSLLKNEIQVGKEREMPLHTAVREGRIHFLKWIVGRRGKGVLTQRSTRGDTVMHTAVKGGNVQLIKWLLTQVPKLLTEEGEDGLIPMLLAVVNGNLEVMQLFHKEAPQLLHKKWTRGTTLMHFAAAAGEVKVMKWLDQQDPNMLSKSRSFHETPMMIACDFGRIEAVEWMCEKNPRLLDEAGWFNITPMFAACVGGQLEMMQLLYRKNPACLKDKALGQTLMQQAAGAGHLKIVQWLHGEDPEMINRPSWATSSPLLTAHRNGHTDVLRWLHANGAEAKDANCRIS